MRNIIKNLELPVGGESQSFRLTKWDALSGVCLLRQVLSHLPKEQEIPLAELPERIFLDLSDYELKPILVSALNHAEMLLPAGYQPVMIGSDWGVPELEHDTAVCLKLALESCVWTLRDFFTEGESTSPKKAPDSSP